VDLAILPFRVYDPRIAVHVIWRRRAGWRWIATPASCCRCIVRRFGWVERGISNRSSSLRKRWGGLRCGGLGRSGRGRRMEMDIVARLEATRSRTLKCFDLSEEQLDRNYGPGKWTVRFLLHHLADAETVLFDRIRRVIRTQAGARNSGNSIRSLHVSGRRLCAVRRPLHSGGNLSGISRASDAHTQCTTPSHPLALSPDPWGHPETIFLESCEPTRGLGKSVEKQI
jgi:hypothetical protein